jgi:hypothetical protein
LHTWNKTLLVHPHIHCLVSGCGLSPSGELKVAVKDFLLPYDVIKYTFRRNARETILKALDKGKLTLPDDMRPQQVINMMNKIGRKKWNVRICDKISRVDHVMGYLARYIRGGPISNRRIVEIGDNAVTFNYGRKKPKFMTLSINEFIERFLQHIPPPNARWVRAYGLYSSSKTDALDKCRALLGQDPVEKPEKIKGQDGFNPIVE